MTLKPVSIVIFCVTVFTTVPDSQKITLIDLHEKLRTIDPSVRWEYDRFVRFRTEGELAPESRCVGE